MAKRTDVSVFNLEKNINKDMHIITIQNKPFPRTVQLCLIINNNMHEGK